MKFFDKIKKKLLFWILGERAIRNIESIVGGKFLYEEIRKMNVMDLVKSVEDNLELKYLRSFKDTEDSVYIECSCYSPYHSIKFGCDPWFYNEGDYNSEEPEIYMTVQLSKEYSFLKRIHRAFKYIISNKEYEYHTTLLNAKETKKIIRFLNKQLIIHRNCKKQFEKNKKESLKYDPDWSSPPGDSIKELMEFKKLDIIDVSNLMNIPIENVKDLLSGKMEITESVARRLEFAFGVPYTFWKNREKNYRESLKKNVC